MRTGRKGFLLQLLFVALILGLALGLPVLQGACAGDDDGFDYGGCTLESCMSSCLARGLPGGFCDGDLCICEDPPTDADADGDGDVTDADADVPPDRPDVPDDGPVDVEVTDGDLDGEFVDDAEIADEVRDDAPREEAGPRCPDLSRAWTFNLGESGWTHEAVNAPATGSWDPWELGTPTGGPGNCHGGGTPDQCWATGLTGDYPTCQRAELRAPTYDMSPCATSALRVDVVFWHWYSFGSDTGSADGGVIEISGDGGVTWAAIEPLMGWGGLIEMDLTSGTPCEGTVYVDGRDGFLGASGGLWVQDTVRVPPEYLTAEFTFRFVFGSDARDDGVGWFIDDVAILVH